MSIVILEGPDGGGKTTLINRLCDDLDQDMMERASTSKGGPVDNLCEWTKQDLRAKTEGRQKGLLLHDRYPLLSEPIYGPLARGSMKEGFASDWFGRAWHEFLELKPTIIFCLPPLDVVVRNVYQEDIPQMDGVVFNINAIYWNYYTLLQRFRAHPKATVRTVIWDYTDKLNDENYKILLKHLRAYKEKAER